jgi:hypothetical protein
MWKLYFFLTNGAKETGCRKSMKWSVIIGTPGRVFLGRWMVWKACTTQITK